MKNLTEVCNYTQHIFTQRKSQQTHPCFLGHEI